MRKKLNLSAEVVFIGTMLFFACAGQVFATTTNKGPIKNFSSNALPGKSPFINHASPSGGFILTPDSPGRGKMSLDNGKKFGSFGAPKGGKSGLNSEDNMISSFSGIFDTKKTNGFSQKQNRTKWYKPESPGTPIPEPATLILFGTGLVGMRIRRKKRG